MPFIFGEDDDQAKEEGEEEDPDAGPSARPAPVRGRRTFNDRGQEVLQTAKEVRAHATLRRANLSVAACQTSDRIRRSPTLKSRNLKRVLRHFQMRSRARAA